MVSPFPQPGMLPPGALAGMPPGSPMGGAPPMAPPPPPPEPAPPLPPTSAAEQVLLMLRTAIEAEGDAAVRDRFLEMPEQMIALVWGLADESDELAVLLESLFPTDPEGPTYPRWFERPPKPEPQTVRDLAADDESFYADYREETRINLAYFHAPGTGELFGAFKNFDRQKEQPYYSSALTDEVNLIKNQIASAALTFQVPYADPALENDTQIAEDALYAWDAEEARRYQRSGNNPIRHDEAFYLLVCGMVAWRTGLKPTRPEHPFDDALLNPVTVFPVWDEEGLCRVTRKYSDTVMGVLSCYDVDGAARRKILAATKDRGLKAGETKRLYRLDDRVQCTTYTDRWWYTVLVDDVVVIDAAEHKYGFVPYVVAKSGLGEPMALVEDFGRAASTVSPTSSGSQLRMRYKFVSHFQYRKRAHEQREAVGNKLYNLMSTIDKPDFWIEQDEVAEAAKLPGIKTGGGGSNMNPIKMNHERPVPILASPNAGLVMQPLMALMGSDNQTGAVSPAQYGVFESANQSGNATEGAVESGGDKRQVHLDTLEGFHAAKQEMRLAIWRDWGHLVENEQGAYGELVVPTRKRRRLLQGAPRAVKVTPEIVRRTGTRVEASLRHVRMQNLAALGNAGAVWMQNNAMSAREMMEMRGVRDPDDVFLEREYEQALLDPQLQQTRRLQILRGRDPMAARMYENLINAKSQPQGPPGMGGPPMPPPGIAGPVAPNTSAMDLNALGMGQQGPTGRPPGPPGTMLSGTDVGP